MSLEAKRFNVQRGDGKPLTSGVFVLRPFKEDGTIHDEAAVNALLSYALSTTDASLQRALESWIDNPVAHPATLTLGLNPCPASYCPNRDDSRDDCCGD